jgi:hypothetical protein
MKFVRTFSLVALLLGAVAAKAQPEMPSREYAKDPCELRTDNRIFVEAPLKTRGSILKELSQHSNLSVVERPEEADFFLIFSYAGAEAASSNALANSNLETLSAEMTVLKYVSNQKGGTRQRILLYWSEQRSIHTVHIPFSLVSSTGLNMPRSSKSLLAEIVGRGILWGVSKVWSKRFQFDPLSDQLTLNVNEKLEISAIKWFLKELKNVRSSSNNHQCKSEPLLATTPFFDSWNSITPRAPVSIAPMGVPIDAPKGGPTWPPLAPPIRSAPNLDPPKNLDRPARRRSVRRLGKN